MATKLFPRIKISLHSLALCLLAMAAAVPAASEQASLSGSIKDPQGRAIAGAIVRLYSRTGAEAASTTTDPTGAYRFDPLAPGDYLLDAEAAGFAPYIDEHLRIEGPVTRHVSLSVAGLREQVVVTAQGTAQAPDEVSKTLSTIDRNDIERRDVFSIGNAVSLAPGVRVQQLGGPGQLTSIHIRGMRDQDTAVLIDGMRLRDAAAVEGDATGLIQDMLFTDSSRIEVMNGAGSSLYGTNAIGGTVNILTDEGGGRTRGSVLMEGGSLDTMRGRALVSGGALHDRIQYSAGAAYENVLTGVDGDDPFRDTNVQGRIAYRISSTTTLSARLFAADAFAKLNSSPAQTGALPASGIVAAVPGVTFVPGPDDPDSTLASRFLSGALALAGQPSARLGYSLSFQTLISSRRYGDGPAGLGFQPAGNQRTLYDGRIQTAQAQAHYQLLPWNLVTAGYEFESEQYAYDFTDASDPLAASSVNATQKSHALFAHDQASLLGSRLQLSAGFRAQWFSLNQPLFGPAASAPFQGGSSPSAFGAPPAAYTGDASAGYFFRRTGTKLRGHAGRGYRAPSLFQRFGAGFDSFFGYSTYGDPRLRPERSIGFDAGIDQMLWGGRARASATYFYTRLNDVVAFAPITGTDPFGRFFGYVNTQGGLSRGVELSASVSPGRAVDVTAAYTFTNAAERTPIVGGVLRTFIIPRNQFSLVANWRAGSRTVFTFDTLDSGDYLAPIFGFPDTRVYRFDGLRRVNASASYRLPLGEFKAMRFFVRAENLTGQDYFESGFRTPGRIGRGGVQYEF
jgi:vitamin B12 transporter